MLQNSIWGIPLEDSLSMSVGLKFLLLKQMIYAFVFVNRMEE